MGSIAARAAVALIAAVPIALGGSAAADRNHAPSAPRALMVDDQARPLAVEGAPEFGWLPRDADPGETQTAYQIRVLRAGATVWDSGRVASSAQTHVAGPDDLAAATVFTWTVRTWDGGGAASPWARPASFGTGLADADWQAGWIRRTTAESDDYTLARRDFTPTASPVTSARAYVAASHQYELRLNGRVVDRGGAFSYPGEGYYRAVDITGPLASGMAGAAGRPVTLGAIVHWYGSGQGRPKGEPGLLVRVVVEHADGSRQIVVTDGSWRVARGPWRTAPRRNGDGGDFIEEIDGTAEPVGWDRPGFDPDPGSWSAPQVIGVHPAGVFTRLRAQETGLTHRTVRPVTVTKLASGAVVADFGTVIPAVPVVRFRDGAAGRHVAMTAGFVLAADGTVSNSADDNQDTDLSYGYTERDGDQTFRAFTYEGFRYLQIADPGVSADDISAVVQHTDVDLGRTARLRTSDSGVDAAFQLMLRSALYSSQEQFLDTPTREKGQFLADAVDISLATMAGFGERRLTRKAIREFSASQRRFWPDGRLNAVYPNGDGKRDIPDFTAMFPGWVWQYHLQSGDTGTLAEAYPVMAAVADYLRRFADPSTGLVTELAGGTGPYLFGIVDWPNRYGYDMATAAHTTVNILAVDALEATAGAARALGRPPAEVTALRRDAQALTGAINARLRRADGVYIDGLLPDGSQSTHASQIANAYAVAYGVAPAQTREAVIDHIVSLGLQMGPMTAHQLMVALAERPGQVVGRLTDPSGIGWAGVLASGGTFTWESWEAPDTGESLSHGWGSTSLVDILQTLLGVTVTAPGAAQVRIRPPATGLTAASGIVPTERGPVGVEWRRTAGGLTLTVDVPVNVAAEVHVPVPEAGDVTVRGEARLLGERDGHVAYAAGSGRLTFTAPPPAG